MEEDPGERTPALGGSGGPAVRAHSSSPRRVPLFERASARWWNPQFRSPALEVQYWKCSFPQLRDRFRSGLVYISFDTPMRCMDNLFGNFRQGRLPALGTSSSLTAAALIMVCLAMLSFTLCSSQYQRFYMPTSFLCTFLICLVTLLIFSSDSKSAFMTPVASLATSFQVVLLIYTVIPLPLYLCILIGLVYSCLFEMLSRNRIAYGDLSHIQVVLHIGVHLLGVHLFILTQVRQRKTFLKVGQSLLARKDLELETQFKDHMIQSVMPKKVADELLKDASELRRPSASLDSNCRTNSATQRGSSEEQPLTLLKSVPDVRKFRPFTMNLMTDVSILFADIAGFTKMSSNKSADELVNLLNDLFGSNPWCGPNDCPYGEGPCQVFVFGKVVPFMGPCDSITSAEWVAWRRSVLLVSDVMCGMVGTKRFKFDVFSNDVNLANEMESTGIAGRVHVSEATAKYLREDYILEDGPDYDGPLRMQVQGTERRVKPASMKTYFIKGRIRDSLEDGLDAGSDREIAVQKSAPVLSAKPKTGFKQSNSICIMEENKKSASLQALATSNLHNSNPETTNSISEKNPQKSSSGSNSVKGSRSSGLQLSLQDGSDLCSVGGLDTAISHHHNAASLTRRNADRLFVGAVLIALPFGVAVCVMPLCILDECPTTPLMPTRLLFSYIMIVALFAHCNFSQLGAWPKTIQCIVVGLIHISAVYYCQANILRLLPQVLHVSFEGRSDSNVIGDFDELLDRPEFCHVEKIKTIGAAYMAASGLNPERKRNMEHPKEHLYQATIQHVLSVFNEDLLNFDFVCKLGLNIGPVTAGVIGTTKLYYDIWGDTVNIASRMYSTGVLNRVQVCEN
ncbi:Guanylate cyclase domain-containing protein [Trichostrongylus colubriformis]|uniref:adenylate cyclase n=1 Tax=Trichostrongylus colubriformis TaxID=6319 RepID=A0AAN8FMR1_TRICO